METITKLVCCECDKPIEPEQGKIIEGNIYQVKERIDDRGGLVGNNIIYKGINNGYIAEVKEVAYCDTCLVEKVLYKGQQLIYKDAPATTRGHLD